VIGMFKAVAFIIAWFVVMTKTALAHHLMGGVMPSTFAQGLLSGLGHPVIGIEHLAAVVAIGCLAATYRAGAWLTVAFVLAMMAGVGLHVRGTNFPGGEFVVAASVVVLGGLLLSRWRPSADVALLLFAAVGVIHGYALGESIAGAEPAPLAAYFAGLAAIQIVIANTAMLFTRSALRKVPSESLSLYLVGVAVAGVGLVFMAQKILA